MKYTVEVLAITMKAQDFSLVESMNITGNVIIANQTDHFDYITHNTENGTAILVSTKTKGASLNRNIALSLATKDIVVFCDDDVHFVDNYERIIINEFEKHPNADVIKFYCDSLNKDRPLSYKNPGHFKKATKASVLSAGVVLLAAKLKHLKTINIKFDETLGPGTENPNGEDSVFINDIIKSKSKFYLSPCKLGTVTQEGSSWFAGFNTQFFYTAGKIYKRIYGVLAYPVALRRAYRMSHSPECRLSFREIFSSLKRGIES